MADINRIEGSERNRITDFGEKIGGAKKDLWKKRGLEVSDLMSMNEKERVKHITKGNIWPTPNYQELVDNGCSVRAAYFIKMIKDATPTKPVLTFLDKDPEAIQRKQEGYVEFVNDLKKNVMNIKTDDDVLDFYENYLSQYLTKNGRYVEVKAEAYDCIDNKLLKAAQVRGFSKIDGDIKNKQFLYTEEEKILSNYMILKYDQSITFDKDYKNRTVMNVKYPGGTMFFYPKDEYEDITSWEENKYFILKGRDIFEYNIESKEAAKEIILGREKAKAITKTTKEVKKKYQLPQFEHLEYVGPDYRDGKDIDGNDYLNILKFKGGEFGNWVNEKERQESLNYGFESLMVLADVLDLDPESISLGNSLSIAFGARGSGSAVAHYEPAREVINLTKMKGAGSLAHEWAHAMDDILNKNISTKGYNNRNVVRLPEHDDLIDKMKNKYVDKKISEEIRDENIKKKEERVARYVKTIIPDRELNEEQIIKRDELIKSLLNDRTPTPGNYVSFGKIEGAKVESIENLSKFKKEITNKKIPLANCKDINHLMYELNRDREIEVKREKVPTVFYRDAIILDTVFSKESKGYWQSSDEMFARAFACYVADKAAEKGIVCDYLTGHAEATIIPYKGEIARGFPIGEERKEINKAFDVLINKYKELGLLKEKTIEFKMEKEEERKQLTLFDKVKAAEKRRAPLVSTTNDSPNGRDER